MNHAALLDFPNFIGPNGPNYDSQTSHFVGVVTLQKCGNKKTQRGHSWPLEFEARRGDALSHHDVLYIRLLHENKFTGIFSVFVIILISKDDIILS